MRQRSVEAQLRGKKRRHKRHVTRSKDCGHKRRYRDHAEAISVLRSARDQANGQRTIPIRAYECNICGGWHLTSQADRG